MRTEIGFNIAVIGDGTNDTVKIPIDSSPIDISFGGNNETFRSRRIYYPDSVSDVSNGGGGPAIASASVAGGVLTLVYESIVGNDIHTNISGTFSYDLG